MRTSIFSSSWLGLGLGVVALGWSVPASAQDCAADADCPKGFTCEVSETTSCVDVACPEGDDSCEAREAECTVEEYSRCESIDCSADSDCADGMACETLQYDSVCPTGGATPDPGEEPAPDGADPVPPDAPAEGECEVEERNYCVPRYLLPCEAAADCGPGFTCEATERCSCSGGSSASTGGGSSTTGGNAGMPEPLPPDDAGDADSDDAERPAEPLPEGEDDGVDDGGVDETCECEAGPVACQLVITECAANSDCPSGMTCEDNPEGSCSFSDGEEECTADPEKICLPPYIDLVQGGAIAGGVDSQAESSADPEEPPRGASGESDDDSNEADGSDDGSSASGGGCSVGGAGAPLSAWTSLGLVLGAAVLGRRRRSGR